MLNLSLLFYSWSNLHYPFFFVFLYFNTYLKYNGGFSTVPLLNPKFLGLSIIQEIFWTNQGSC